MTPTLWCTPHTPIAHVVNSYFGLPAPSGPSIDYPPKVIPAHDDHGNTIQQAGLSVEMTGPGGTITLTHGGPTNDVVLRGWGDFNGDGRTDLLVDVVYGQPDDATFIVLGSVGPGTLDPFAVGIRVPHPHIKPGGFEAFPASVGDQNGDGADDVSFGPKLYSGRQLTALSPGAALPAPFRTLPSQYVGLLQIDANKPPSFVLLDRARASLRVLDVHSDQLLLKVGPTALAAAVAEGARATGWLVDNHYIVEFDYGSRAGDTAWRWDLNSACGA